ncbi:MAG TPA: leucine--tRNA ligase [Polyangia bacterium]|nr:leucine--tRNA ligase [Polyangia bacterium]
MDDYDPHTIEPKWQETWREQEIYRARADSPKPKYYVLEMFPYPSGRIHMGHVRNYSIGDVLARLRRMQGYEVFYPMGWDAFGMPAENAAIKAGAHPRAWTYDNIRAMRAQLKRMGYSYDWTREIATCHPGYYKWEQLVFLEMFERGLAYRKLAPVNWCPRCGTVLANEQIIDGSCWRCGTQVTQRELEQWFLQITRYADELLFELDRLAGGWPAHVVKMQRDWIGRSEGAEIEFPLADPVGDVRALGVFTTRPDTLYGATFMSIAAEHPLAEALAGGSPELAAFIKKVRAEDRIKRAREGYEKEGLPTGAFCINPGTGEKIPIFVANFVLMEYGTGAIMAVPAHDQRDFEFARKYGLPIRVVIQPPDRTLDPATMEAAYIDDGIMVSSGPFDGLSSAEGKQKVTAHLARSGRGRPSVHYRLRDWLISRQRYWGAPIPVVYCPSDGIVPVRAGDLPITLPDDVELTGEGESPLKRHPTWSHTTCPRCGGPATRETDTMDTFVESSWYFLRYCDPRNDRAIFDRRAVEHFMPVDQYIGGVEHAILHLLYARFWTKVLRDLHYLGFGEPFTRLLAQGMVHHPSYFCPVHEWVYPNEVEDQKHKDCGQVVRIMPSEVMSKSHKNVIDPDVMVAKYGADTMRVFMLFTSPPEAALDWSEEAIEGASRFLARVWRLCAQHLAQVKGAPAPSGVHPLRRATHLAIAAVTREAAERFHFNKAIADIMSFVNTLYQARIETDSDRAAMREALETLILLLSPFAPHISAELWQAFGHAQPLPLESWPQAQPELARRERMTIVVQVNGKVRARLELDPDADEPAVQAAALDDASVRKWLEGRPLRSVKYVPGRILSLVT